MSRLSIAFSLVVVACGGVVDPQPQPQPVLVSDDAATVDAEPDAAVEASSLHFACLILAASTPTFVECTTLADGTPSYVDESDIDCRKYFEGSGQGCAPPMTCTASYEGKLVTGSCAQVP